MSSIVDDFFTRYEKSLRDQVGINTVRVPEKEQKPRFDCLGRKLNDGDLFVFIDSDNIPKIGLASLPFNSELEWFNVVYTESQIYTGKKEFWRLDKPFEKFIVFRETREFSSIPKPDYITIIRDISLDYGKFYKKFW